MARCDIPRPECYHDHCYGHLREPRPSGRDSARSFCPAHNDTERSLSFSAGDKQVVWHCHAGCDSFTVRQALIRDGIHPDCLPVPRARQDEVVDAITRMCGTGISNAELRWRVYSLVQGFGGELPTRGRYPGGRRGFARDAGVGHSEMYEARANNR